ncbi:MAG: hypothetical protein MZV49_09490 [Rhodopseudomonas palustris]|nr:hypothetical protein [Rhodopseudomonas palustris]
MPGQHLTLRTQLDGAGACAARTRSAPGLRRRRAARGDQARPAAAVLELGQRAAEAPATRST